MTRGDSNIIYSRVNFDIIMQISSINLEVKSWENQNVEWKETWHDEYLKWICGFANVQGDILLEIYDSAEKLKQERIEREEAERKRREEEACKKEIQKLYNIEVDQTNALINCAEDYEIACKIRHYITKIESSDSLDEETKEWIEWAKAKADWYDPIISQKDKLFGVRQHKKDTRTTVKMACIFLF